MIFKELFEESIDWRISLVLRSDFTVDKLILVSLKFSFSSMCVLWGGKKEYTYTVASQMSLIL